MTNPKQMGFFDRIHPVSALINISETHELLRLTKVIPWQDQIKHYAPARHLCNLMDSSWSPDHITIFDFVQMLGPAGMEKLNTTFLKEAQELGILDSTSLMSDTTAQEAMIPYPNEVGLIEKVYRFGFKNHIQSWNQSFENKVEGQRDIEKSKITGSRITLVCKDERAKADSWQKTLSHDDGASKVIGFNEYFISANSTFYKNRFCGTEKDYSFTDVGALLNRSRQSGKVSRNWNQMGYQQDRWFCTGFCDGQCCKCVRQEILYRFYPKTYRTFWRSSKDIRLRQRWLQWAQYQQGEKTWREKCGYCTARPGRMVRVDEDVGKDQMRTSPGRRFNWKFKIKKIRLQQTQCEINSGNDYVGTPRVLGLQSMQSITVIESAESFAGVMKSESSKSNERYELIHRKINCRA